MRFLKEYCGYIVAPFVILGSSGSAGGGTAKGQGGGGGGTGEENELVEASGGNHGTV